MASYQGTTINPGSDADVASQVAAIDKKIATPANGMPADALGSTPSPYATYFPPPTASAGLAETATASKDAYLARSAAEADALSGEQATGKTAIQKIFGDLGLKSGERANLYETTGVNQDKKDVDELTSQIESRTRAYDKQIAAATDNNPTGQLESGQNIEVNRLSKQKASELADLAIVLNAKTRNYSTAKSIVDTKVDAETEDLKSQLDGLKYFYTENEGKLTQDQRDLLQDKIQSADNEYQDKRDLRQQIGDLQLAAAKNGAPASVVSAIGAAQDVSAAVTAGAGFFQDTNGSGTFSTTQINQGAANAGLPIAEFAALDADTKNYFISNYDAFSKLLASHANGDVTDDELASDIATSGQPQGVQDILYKKAGVTAPTDTESSSGGGFFSNAAQFARTLIGI